MRPGQWRPSLLAGIGLFVVAAHVHGGDMDRDGWLEIGVPVEGREDSPMVCLGRFSHPPPLESLQRRFQASQLMAKLPATEEAREGLKVCADVMRSPVADPEAKREGFPWVPGTFDTRPVPPPKAYFDAVFVCLRSRGLDVDRESLWIKSGVSAC